MVTGTGSLLLIILCCQLRLSILRKVLFYLPHLPLPLSLKLRLVIGRRVVPVGTAHLWMLRVRAHHSFASVHLPLFVRARSGGVAAFCLLTIRVKALAQVVESLLQKGVFELAPLSSLGYYSRLFFIMKALGSWRPVLNLAFVPHCAQDTSS